ncbi:MAG: ABC transporter ATP-binding protein, partial [Myxococcota bacterium]|nr:ABC transporter ATP-binding protein [Myxococcota bacterium]
NGVSFEVREGEFLGIVGESGSGKSVTAKAIMNLLPSYAEVDGTITFDGRDVRALAAARERHFWGVELTMVFQDPMTSLNPVKRIGEQIAECLRVHLGRSHRAARATALDLLEQVGIPEPGKRLRQYPHELSGGLRQRVVIAMALACGPRLLIADEPTTALDVTVQKHILDLLDDLRRDRDMSMVLITHDLGVVAGMADHVLVMYSGKTMESGPTEALFARPSHPYTLGLLRSLPRVDATEHTRLYSIPGRPPDLNARPPGCPFAPRCSFVREVCHTTFPDMATIGPGHHSACHATDEVQALVTRGDHLEAPEVTG